MVQFFYFYLIQETLLTSTFCLTVSTVVLEIQTVVSAVKDSVQYAKTSKLHELAVERRRAVPAFTEAYVFLRTVLAPNLQRKETCLSL